MTEGLSLRASRKGGVAISFSNPVGLENVLAKANLGSQTFGLRTVLAKANLGSQTFGLRTVLAKANLLSNGIYHYPSPEIRDCEPER
jgi:hypothetical protein